VEVSVASQRGYQFKTLDYVMGASANFIEKDMEIAGYLVRRENDLFELVDGCDPQDKTEIRLAVWKNPRGKKILYGIRHRDVWMKFVEYNRAEFRTKHLNDKNKSKWKKTRGFYRPIDTYVPSEEELNFVSTQVD
jgi:hypothetical protein